MSLPTIKRLEVGTGVLAGRVQTLTRLVEAMTKHGVCFLEEGEVSTGYGVSLAATEQK